jgi:hypothetical protein
MRSFAELEQAWAALAPLPRVEGTVSLVTVRTDRGVHETPQRIRLSPDDGVVGDRWKRDDGKLTSQVSVMMTAVAELVGDGEQPLHMAGDNLLVDLDLGEAAVAVGTRWRIGSALLEVTPEPHTPCKLFSARFGVDASRWVAEPGHSARRLRGLMCQVIEAGEIAVGDVVEVVE